MDEQQIAELVKLIEQSKMPQWWIDYAEQLAYNLQVHTKGLMFDKVTGLYPNEHPESQKHCISSYESITKGSIWKAINNIIRVFNNSSYNVSISDKLRATIEKYQDREGSLFSQFLEDWIKYAIATDPNGICVTYPPEYTTDFYRYVCYKDIKLISDDVLIFISEVESETKIEMTDVQWQKEIFFDYQWADGAPNVRHASVRTYNRKLEKKYVNEVYHVFTKTHFVRVYKEKSDDTEWQYEYYEYPAEFDTLPYFENGGVEVETNVYESFVQPFIPFGNLALMAHRNHRAVDLMFSYPRMSEVQQHCDACHGEGRVKCETGEWETCKICKGSKYTVIQSPYKVYRKVHDSFDPDGKVFTAPSVEFYSPNAAILDYSKKEWAEYLRKAEEAVFVQQKVSTGNVESAESKSIDREELYSWLANISKVLYGNLQMFLQYLENYMSPNPVAVSVEKPYSFAILTESEAFAALRDMLSSPAPVLLKASQIDNFVNKFISESSPVKRALNILKKFDLLLYYSSDEVNNLKGQGFVDTPMCQKHTLAYPVLIQMYEINPKLFDLEDEQIINKLSVQIEKFNLARQLREVVLNGNGREEEIEEDADNA